MKVILYMALTVNGMIAKEDGNSEWVSEEDTTSFVAMCQKTKAVIMGRHTYDVLSPDDLPLKEGLQIVMTNNKVLRTENQTVVFTNKEPKEVLSMLEKKGYQEACVIGGSQTVSQFMKERLIDEVYFDIEPLLFGKGMPLFQDVDFEYNLQLLDIKKLNEHTIQLHYKIVKDN